MENVDKNMEMPVIQIPGMTTAAEAYFSPDGQSLICNAKLEGDEAFQVYTARLDGTDIRKINDKGEDACSYFFPDGKRLVYTSTRDNLELPTGSYSDPTNYPQGADIYTCDLHGNDVVRITNNKQYDAEVSVASNGEILVYGHMIDGNMDLWTMLPDGSEKTQITFEPGWQEGGAFFMPDNETIVYRAWKVESQGQRGMPMTLFTIKKDGTGLKALTHDEGTNWAPYPFPDGKHVAFVRILPKFNFEIFMMNIETGEQKRLTYGKGFDGFPAISPDGKTLMFSSSRDAAEGTRNLRLYLMDISSLW